MTRNRLFSVPTAVIILTSIIAYMPFSQLLFIHAQGGQDSIFRIATTGDISCSNDGKKTIGKIKEQTPDLVLWLGDLSYDKPFTCFTDLTSGLHQGNKDTAVIGNHDDEGEDGDHAQIRSQVIDHFKLSDNDTAYWSKTIDVPNNNESNDILLVGMDSQSNYKQNSSQFKFVKQVLENSNASLKIVLIHKPFLTCDCKHGPHTAERENDQLDTYRPLFKDTGVDLVLQGHNHNVQYYDLVDNVRYLLSGAGGKSHYSFLDDNNHEIPMPKPTKFKDDHSYGFTLIDANFATNQLSVKFITNNGNDVTDSKFSQSFGGVPQQPDNETFKIVDIGKGNATFVPSNQSIANQTIAVDAGVAILPKP